MNTDTPRTDAMYESHTSEYQRRLLSEDLERRLAAEMANREKCCRDGNAISDELFDTQQKLKKAEAEVERLDHLLADASETNHKLAAEVERLKDERIYSY
jgi:glutaredoxin 2